MNENKPEEVLEVPAEEILIEGEPGINGGSPEEAEEPITEELGDAQEAPKDSESEAENIN